MKASGYRQRCNAWQRNHRKDLDYQERYNAYHRVYQKAPDKTDD